MKTYFKRIVLLWVFLSTGTLQAQEWMKSLEIAKKLALTQDKLLFVMWEDAIQYQLPAVLSNDQGEVYYVKDLLLSETANEMIWEYFVPVLINESAFNDMYESIKEDRSYGYLQLFRDDGIKIMDVNGNILNTAFINYNYFDFTKFIEKYALNTAYLKQEYRNYKEQKDFYTIFYLANKYVEFAVYNSSSIRPELIELSNIYFDELDAFLDSYEANDKDDLLTRVKLAKIQQNLVLKNPVKVLRQLNRIDREELSEVNKEYLSFLYFTAYKLDGDIENMKKWESQVSSLNLKKADTVFRNLLD